MELKNILVLGDSHAMVFKSIYFKLFSTFFLNSFKFKVIWVGGATISGIENPNSKTQSCLIFKKALQENLYCKYCLVNIGEVDTGFVLWYKKEKENQNIDNLLNHTVEKMKKFLIEINNYGYKPIVVSTPLPTIKDNCQWGEVSNLRKEIKATQKERTLLTLRFNQIIQDFCLVKGYYNINLDSISLNKNGLVKRIFRHYNKSNHHYNPIVYSLLSGLKLRSLLGQKNNIIESHLK